MSALRPTPKYLARALILVVVVAAAALFELVPRSSPPPQSAEFRILCTFLPVYVLTANVVGDIPGVSVELMLASDIGCPHTYTARPADHMKVARAQVVVANGLGMEPFLDELARAHPKARVITISEGVDVLESRCADADAHDGHDHAHGPNGHVWVSPIEAARQVRNLADQLGAIDPARKDRYDGNAASFIARLGALRQRMTDAASGFRHRNIVTMHDSFDYLARDLGLNVVATLQPDEETEPTAGQMGAALDAIRREGVRAVLYESSAMDRVAKSVAREAGIEAYALNPLTVWSGPVDAGAYEAAMNQNLEVLKRALGDGS